MATNLCTSASRKSLAFTLSTHGSALTDVVDKWLLRRTEDQEVRVQALPGADNASEPNNRGTEDVKAYASCSVAPTSPKVTENPLYKRVAPPFSGPKPATQRYELVKPSSDEEASPPDSPLPELRSIQNPNYENTLPLTTPENVLPDANC
ncbi:unnamed protein product [Porites evermanni]|uniref:Uncharacterized protein n=1 Tax=Porites evermanni TaxID=104178 RepID=A0ABN8SUY1_9CNID|nr:unnamed protein product [Porites evermanni]